jgi:hypothetical protein
VPGFLLLGLKGLLRAGLGLAIFRPWRRPSCQALERGCSQGIIGDTKILERDHERTLRARMAGEKIGRSHFEVKSTGNKIFQTIIGHYCAPSNHWPAARFAVPADWLRGARAMVSPMPSTLRAGYGCGRHNLQSTTRGEAHNSIPF